MSELTCTHKHDANVSGIGEGIYGIVIIVSDILFGPEFFEPFRAGYMHRVRMYFTVLSTYMRRRTGAQASSPPAETS